MSSAQLLVVRGPETGLRFALDSGRALLGSDPSVDISLLGSGIAKRHCEIRAASGVFTIYSLTPEPSSFLNGVPIREAILSDGDRLRLGNVDLLFRADDSPQSNGGHAMIAACSLFYLFRAMHGLDLDEQNALEAQIREIAAADLGPGSLDIFVGGQAGDWAERLNERGRESLRPWPDLLAEAERFGSVATADFLLQIVSLGINTRACLAWHSPGAPKDESTLAALAAIASASLETAAERTNLEIRTSLAEEQIANRTGIIGHSPATQLLLRNIEKVAPRETTVLIQGESGTGKELVARALHRLSPRATRPFVALNCAAITETLLESELFGHEKGAFTGATEQRPGKLELAAGGSVFLDEIGEMALPLQAKMLRVLQQREFERVGGRKTLPLDIRVIAATNRDLASEVKRGAFREDLFHRLNVVTLRTPPLRERSDDIELLAHAFLARSAAAAGRTVTGFTRATLAALRNYNWPGNIRELQNSIERAVVLGDLPEVQLEDLPESILESSLPGQDSPAFHRSIHDAKRSAIIDSWRTAGGDYKAAAALLGVHPNSLLRMIRKLDLRTELGT